MLRISKLTDYGIVLLAHLASDGADRTHNAREMARLAHLPEPVVSKLLKQLAREGLLVSQRGAKGGYGLARDPEATSVAEIITALEGPIALTECGLAEGVCAQESSCRVRDPWQQINRAVYAALSRVTLADLARPAAGGVALPLAALGIEAPTTRPVEHS